MPIQRRLPKFGFSSRKGLITAEIRLDELCKVEGDIVDLAALKKAGVISGVIKFAKVMLSGKVEKAITLKGIKATKGAAEAITAAGGKIEA
jgi:large subunit ribosomal protein L15